eukprot:2360709-Pleurochrysis_carterae.AAC.1
MPHAAAIRFASRLEVVLVHAEATLSPVKNGVELDPPASVPPPGSAPTSPPTRPVARRRRTAGRR